MYDLIIIGGGPAGVAAGIYSARQKLQTLLITKEFGGQMTKKAVAIENYPGFEKISGLQLSQKFEKHLRKQGIEIERDSVSLIKKADSLFYITTGNRQKFEARAVIVASGADPRPLEVPGEKKYIGRGVSYCATCDAPLFAGKEVAVIGGGNAGFETAVALSRWAEKIYILERSGKLAADEANQEMARRTKRIQTITNVDLKKIDGEQFVHSIVYQDSKTGKKTALRVEGVFVEIGNVPATGFVKNLVEFNNRDEIKINPGTNMTKTPGLFAAGDATDIKYKQIVIAAGQGTQAALSVSQYLK